MEVENIQLSQITQMILKNYNAKFDKFQKENNKLCNETASEVKNGEEKKTNIDIEKTYGLSILGVNNLSEQNFDKIISNKIEEIEERNKTTHKENFTCNFEAIDKRIVDVNGINSKNTINFIEDQEFMYKVIKYRRLEVIKQLLYFKKTITLFKYLCISEKNLAQKQEKMGIPIFELQVISSNKDHVKDIIEFIFIGNNATKNTPAINMLKKTLCKYLFLTTNFYKIIPKQKNTKEQQEWNELLGKEEEKKLGK